MKLSERHEQSIQLRALYPGAPRLYSPQSISDLRRSHGRRFYRSATMDYLQSLRMFVKVAELGSFTGAADQLKVSSAVATRSVASLEERLDARLLQRTTRSVTLTEAGRLFLDRVRTIVDEIDDVEGGLLAATGAPAGSLRIAVQGSLG